ncbi:hypothetical protein ACH5RR_021003 [Cinchona calisaya]|uniref:Uncharacterized protein n=1 Tax=Cinchona calisaya TaxID=153742 RepID=A0ABD2ZG32_9GENT
MLIASLFPRPGAVYAPQSLQFKQPVYIGEEITGFPRNVSKMEILWLLMTRPQQSYLLSLWNGSDPGPKEGEITCLSTQIIKKIDLVSVALHDLLQQKVSTYQLRGTFRAHSLA